MKKIITEIFQNKINYFILGFILVSATFLRVFRTDQVLGFYYDQGRDALVIADLLEKGKFFLIGPTTGIAGIFRGPFYYYLIAPFYWLGNGNPVYPAIFLALTTVAALVLLYILGKELVDRKTGIIAVTLASFSFYIMYASRWLSNPTPMLFLSLALLYSMLLIQKGKQWAWIALSFIAGSSLFHFGSSGEFFYFPALLVFALWQCGIFRRKPKFPSVLIIVFSIFAFAITAAPLVIFDLKHDNILSNNLAKFFGADESFKASFWEVAQQRLQFVWDVFYSKIFLRKGSLESVLFLLVIGVGILKLPALLKNKYLIPLFIILLSPVIGLLFFQGNEGNIYDYYLTGYYLLFILFVAVLLRETLRIWAIGIVIAGVFLITSFKQNIEPTWSFIHDGVDGPTTIAFGNQKQVFDWIYTDAAGSEFNIDTYVPPVIPYAYTYLGRWYTNGLGMEGIVEDQRSLLYTIYEVDPPHPERLSAWMKRQEGIGRIVYEAKFGGITVQRRERLLK